MEKLKEILLTLFIQFASQDDLEDRITINHEEGTSIESVKSIFIAAIEFSKSRKSLEFTTSRISSSA